MPFCAVPVAAARWSIPGSTVSESAVPVQPGYLAKLVPEEAPVQGESLQDIMSDVRQKIMPGMPDGLSMQQHRAMRTGLSRLMSALHVGPLLPPHVAAVVLLLLLAVPDRAAWAVQLPFMNASKTGSTCHQDSCSRTGQGGSPSNRLLVQALHTGSPPTSSATSPATAASQPCWGTCCAPDWPPRTSAGSGVLQPQSLRRSVADLSLQSAAALQHAP